VSPFSYAYEALVITEFTGLEFNFNETVAVPVCAVGGGEPIYVQQTREVTRVSRCRWGLRVSG